MSLSGIPQYIRQQILQDPEAFGYDESFHHIDPVEFELNYIRKKVDEGKKDLRIVVRSDDNREELEYDENLEEDYPYAKDGCISLLSYLVLYRRFRAVELLLSAGANQSELWTESDSDYSYGNNYNSEPLPIAIKNSDVSMVELLLEWYPASIPEAVADEFNGNIPYEIARAFPRDFSPTLFTSAYATDEPTENTYRIVDLLYENGVLPPADLVNLLGGEDIPARELRKAVYYGCDVDYTKEEYDYETALMRACGQGLLENAIELVRLGANVNLRDINGRTVEDFCEEGGIPYDSIFTEEPYTQTAIRTFQIPSLESKLNITSVYRESSSRGNSSSIPSSRLQSSVRKPFQRNMS